MTCERALRDKHKHARRVVSEIAKAAARGFTKCPSCQTEARKTTTREIYPHRPDIDTRTVWICDGCGAYVGCHPGTDVPLGVLAGPQLRRAKMEAHKHFDAMWKSEMFGSRSAAYCWLAEKLGVPISECHIGYFDTETCRRVVEFCKAHSHD